MTKITGTGAGTMGETMKETDPKEITEARDELAKMRAERDNPTAQDEGDVTKVDVTKDPDKEVITAEPVKKAGDESSSEVQKQSADERLDMLEKELQLRDLQAEKTQLDTEKWMNLAETRQGELNHLKQGGRTATQSVETDLLNDDGSDADITVHPRFAELEADAVQRAKESTVQQFFNDFEDAKEMEDKMADYFKEHVAEFAPELNSTSPKKVRKATLQLLREARLSVKETNLRQEIKDAKEKRTTANEKARAAKLAAGASESSAGTQGLDVGEKSIDDMSTEELAAILKKDPNRSPYN